MERRDLLATLGMAVLPSALQGAGKVQVIAHRGEHIENAENTLPAIEKAIALGVDFVEIDVRTTKDGRFVLMHDGNVDRMTNGKGNVHEMTFEEIRALNVRGQKVPTLDEALAAMRGRCGVYFDAKRIAAEDIIAALKKHDLMERAVVYGGFPLMKALSEQGHPELAMPEAVSVEVSQRILKELNPKVIAFDRRDFTPEVIALAKGAGKGIFVDRLGQQDTPEHWKEAVAMGATGIQTDHPAELIALLKG